MSNQSTFEGATLDLLRYLREKKQSIETRYASELSEIDKEIEAVALTARLLREAAQNPVPTEELKAVIPPDLHGKTAREACVQIAKSNSGVIRVGDAKDALVSAGILKNSRNTWAIVYTTLSRSKDFEKATPGTFRLVGQSGTPIQGFLQ